MAVKAYSGNYNWEEAQIKCSQDGTDVNGELPAPRSPTDNRWFVDKAHELGLNSFWLGINDRDVEGEYTNQHGSPHNFLRWNMRNPTGDSDTTERDCVRTGGAQGYKWDDIKCTNTIGVLCTNVKGKAVSI